MRTYGNLELYGQHWVITDLEPHVAIRLKNLFQGLPKEETKRFKLLNTMDNATDLYWFMQRYPLEITDKHAKSLLAGHERYLKNQAELERIFMPDYSFNALSGLKDGQELRHYQLQAIEMAHRSHGLLLADECGLGKTYTTAGFCLNPEHLPAIVVSPVAIQKQWKDTIENFTNLRVHMITTTKPYDLPEADVYVFRYTQLSGWSDIFATGFFKSVTYDEPQELRRGLDTDKGRAAEVISDNVQWRMGLSATPVYNYGIEIFNIMQFIRSDVFGKRDDFMREFTTGFSDGKMLKDPKAVGTLLREKFALLRRLKSDVGKELPQVNKIVDFVDYNQKDIDSINQIAKSLALKVVSGTFVERGNAARELDILVRQNTGIAKARSVAALVRILIESGESVLLVGWHRAVYEIWLKELSDLNPVMYTGSESPAQKEKSKKSFMNGETKLIIMSLRSPIGLDGLQDVCSTLVFGELDWSPFIHHQIIERLNREGQTKPVMAMFPVINEGSDPPMLEINGLKMAQASNITDPFGAPMTSNNDRGRLQLLVSRYLDNKSCHIDITDIEA